MLDTADGVVAAHERRLHRLDPLLPATHPLPPPVDGDAPLSGPGAVGLVRHERPDPESLAATWGPAEQYRLLARVGGVTDPAAALGVLLDGFVGEVAGRVVPGDPETGASLTWPSRDVDVTGRLVAQGLVPAAVVAARLAGRSTPPAGDVPVRPLRPGDVPAATGLWLEQVRYDAAFGGATERPSTAAGLAGRLAEAGNRLWVWVAEAGGDLLGLVVVEPPAEAGWVAPLVSRAPAAYLACLVVAGHARGGGVGATLVRHAHAALDRAQVAVTLLHYAALNPLSGPFWHRCGYRPLWTGWQARPASRLSVTV